jgi:lipoyl(octanoyl) transferase
VVRQLGYFDYLPIWQAMQDFTDQRSDSSHDEIWLVEHPPVFTVGLNGKPEHLLDPGNIPVINVDRGGQITYHGPGQLMAYLLVDLRRRHWGVRHLVNAMEQAVIALLAEYGVTARARPDAPGVYVDDAKVVALGLRVRRGCSYHGMCLNVDMDLSPYARINPCGYQGQAITQLCDLGIKLDMQQTGEALLKALAHELEDATLEFAAQSPEHPLAAAR